MSADVTPWVAIGIGLVFLIGLCVAVVLCLKALPRDATFRIEVAAAFLRFEVEFSQGQSPQLPPPAEQRDPK